MSSSLSARAFLSYASIRLTSAMRAFSSAICSGVLLYRFSTYTFRSISLSKILLITPAVFQYVCPTCKSCIVRVELRSLSSLGSVPRVIFLLHCSIDLLGPPSSVLCLPIHICPQLKSTASRNQHRATINSPFPPLSNRRLHH